MNLTPEIVADATRSHSDGASGLMLIVKRRGEKFTRYFECRHPALEKPAYLGTATGRNPISLEDARTLASVQWDRGEACRTIDQLNAVAEMQERVKLDWKTAARMQGVILNTEPPEPPPPVGPPEPDAIPTFAEAATAALAVSGRNEPHRTMAASRLRRYATALATKSVDEITRRDVAGVLDLHHRLGNRGVAVALRQDIREILEWCVAAEYVQANVASGRSLDRLLPKLPARKNYNAVPFPEAPSVFAALADGSEAADALRLQALTAVRPIEAARAEEHEFDLDKREWTIPAARMKSNREHVVPLSDVATRIVADRLYGGRYVFPSLGDQVEPRRPMQRMMRRVAGDAVPHGWRSTFRNWAAETGVAFDVAEVCLAHKVGDATVQAYMRTSMVERRREVMAAWADYLAE